MMFRRKPINIDSTLHIKTRGLNPPQLAQLLWNLTTFLFSCQLTVKDCCWSVTPELQKLQCAHCGHLLSTWSIRTYVKISSFYRRGCWHLELYRDIPKVIHTTGQSDSKAHFSCIILWLDTAIHNLPLLIFHCLPPHSLFSILTYLLNVITYLVLCHLHSFSHGIPQFGDPLHFFKSIIPLVLL